MPTSRVRFDKVGRPRLPTKKDRPELRKLGRPTSSGIFVDANVAGEIRQGWPTKTADQEECPELRKLGRLTWSTIFVDANVAGEIRQGWPTKTADEEGSSRTQKTWSSNFV